MAEQFKYVREKPLSHNLINAKNLVKLLKAKKLITHELSAGYHPAVNKVQRIKKKLGKPLSGTFYFGEYQNVRTMRNFGDLI